MIPHNKPTLGIEEENAALRVLRSGWLSKGSEVKSFENEFCDVIGLPKGHAVAVSSGSAALFISLKILNELGNKVAIPGYVCSALRSAVQMAQKQSILVDVNRNSPNISRDLLKKEKPDIAIIPHMYGIPVDLSNLPNIPIIEDCSHALGAKVNGKSVGLEGQISIFSFYVTKLITTGGFGGILISKNQKFIDEAREFIEYDNKNDINHRFNFQMGDLQAAIGREQLQKLPKFLIRREEIFTTYKEAGLDLLDVSPYEKSLQPVRYRAVLKTKTPHNIIQKLKIHNVSAVIPTNEWIIHQNSKKLSNSFELIYNTVSLPIYPSLSDENVEQIISLIKD